MAGVKVVADPDEATLPASTDGANIVLDAADNGPASNFNAPNREDELERSSSEGMAEEDAARKAAGEEAAADKEDAQIRTPEEVDNEEPPGGTRSAISISLVSV